MGRWHSIIFLIFCGLMVLAPTLSQAQNTRHYVEKGETVYQIARKYNVNPKQVLLLNPKASDLIQIGQELIIPQTTFTPTSPTAGDDSYESYTVIPGDTKFGLSQKFSVSISDLESLNPQMVPMLLADSQIRVPVKSASQAITNREDLKTHLVVKGETLYGIARMYGITLEELIDANAERLGTVLLAGQYLEIPQLNSSKQSVSGTTYLVVKGDTKYNLSKRFSVTITTLENANPSMVPTLMAGDLIVIPDEREAVKTVPPEDNASVVETSTSSENNLKVTTENKISDDQGNKVPGNNNNADSQKAQVASNESFVLETDYIELLLSFTEKDYQSFVQDLNNTAKIAAPFTAQQEEMLNYKGVLKAVDSLTNLQYEVKVNTRYNVNDSLMSAQNLYASGKLFLVPDLNLVLSQIKNPSKKSVWITNNYRDLEPKIASPVFVSRNQSNSSKDFLLNYLKSPEHNLVMISDPTQLDYIASAKANNQNLKFLTESVTKRIDASMLKNVLSASKKNFIIFNTNRNGVFINVTNTLLKLSNQYEIETAIVNQSFLPDSKNVSSTRFKILKMIYPQAIDAVTDGSDQNTATIAERLINQGSNTAYDLIRKLRNYDNSSNILTLIQGDRMEQLQYFKTDDNRFKTGNFTISRY
jgi:LysM repeat protein